jgi:hypothetical protein
MTAAAREVAERMGDESFTDADRADDGHVLVLVDKAQRDELVEQAAIESHLGRFIPALELHFGIEVGTLSADGDRETITTGDFISEDEHEKVLVSHLLPSSERKSLRKRVAHFAELQSMQDRAQIR